jgi:hypothetical protein
VSKGENLRLQCGAAPKTRGDHGTKADENRVRSFRSPQSCRHLPKRQVHEYVQPRYGDVTVSVYRGLIRPGVETRAHVMRSRISAFARQQILERDRNRMRGSGVLRTAGSILSPFHNPDCT